jgi:hypothetical protein
MHEGVQYLAVWTGAARSKPPTELVVLRLGR